MLAALRWGMYIMWTANAKRVMGLQVDEQGWRSSLLPGWQCIFGRTHLSPYGVDVHLQGAHDRNDICYLNRIQNTISLQALQEDDGKHEYQIIEGYSHSTRRFCQRCPRGLHIYSFHTPEARQGVFDCLHNIATSARRDGLEVYMSGSTCMAHIISHSAHSDI